VTFTHAFTLQRISLWLTAQVFTHFITFPTLQTVLDFATEYEQHSKVLLLP